MKRSVLIADDHPIVLSGLSMVIGSDSAFDVVATCTDGLSAIEKLRQLQPDIAVLDLNMPGLTGLKILEDLRRDGVLTQVIILAATLTDAQIFEATQQGAAGILLKEMAPSMLLDCLEHVARGKRWLPSDVAKAAMSHEHTRRSRWRELSSHLTARETEVVNLLVAGSSNKNIAFALDISEGTVKIHINNIFRKAGVNSRTDLIGLAASE